MLFFLDNLLFSQESVSLQCVFHSIRFKVNKGWSKALLLFYAYTLPIRTAILKTHRVFGLPWILFSITDLHKYNMNF